MDRKQTISFLTAEFTLEHALNMLLAEKKLIEFMARNAKKAGDPAISALWRALYTGRLSDVIDDTIDVAIRLDGLYRSGLLRSQFCQPGVAPLLYILITSGRCDGLDGPDGAYAAYSKLPVVTVEEYNDGAFSTPNLLRLLAAQLGEGEEEIMLFSEVSQILLDSAFAVCEQRSLRAYEPAKQAVDRHVRLVDECFVRYRDQYPLRV